jgi:hypothetical protein
MKSYLPYPKKNKNKNLKNLKNLQKLNFVLFIIFILFYFILFIIIFRLDPVLHNKYEGVWSDLRHYINSRHFIPPKKGIKESRRGG